LHYIVTREGCTCPDAKRSQGICKHLWASIGYAVAVAILALREATTTAQINEIMETVAAPSISLPLGFRRTLNAECERALKDATIDTSREIQRTPRRASAQDKED
jgi:uncharacterized Zn finger protein